MNLPKAIYYTSLFICLFINFQKMVSEYQIAPGIGLDAVERAGSKRGNWGKTKIGKVMNKKKITDYGRYYTENELSQFIK